MDRRSQPYFSHPPIQIPRAQMRMSAAHFREHTPSGFKRRSIDRDTALFTSIDKRHRNRDRWTKDTVSLALQRLIFPLRTAHTLARLAFPVSWRNASGASTSATSASTSCSSYGHRDICSRDADPEQLFVPIRQR